MRYRLLAVLGFLLAFTGKEANAEQGLQSGFASEDSAVQGSQAAANPNPVQMVRTLHLMQDQIALGSTEAHLAQRGLLGILDDRFVNFGPDIWQERNNLLAAVSFVLSGGNPATLRKLLEFETSVIPEDDRRIVEGALAYVEGREELAGEILDFVDARSLPPTLSAQIALIQSALVVRKDAAKSDELLDFVRLQAPGTLLEEAALRRQVFVASQTNNIEKFLSLSTDYLRRYRHSVYAGNFRQRLASAMTRIDFGKESSRFDDMVAMMSELEPDAQRELYLLASRASLEQGFVKSARLLADKAQELSRPHRESAARAKLYRSASMITLPEAISGAVHDLNSIDRSVLPDRDLALLDAALSMASQIQKMPELTSTSSEDKTPSPSKGAMPGSSEASTQGPDQLQALSKARDALKHVDSLIKSQAAGIP